MLWYNSMRVYYGRSSAIGELTVLTVRTGANPFTAMLGRMEARTSMKEGGRRMNIIDTLEQEQLRADLPKLEIGDYVKVYVKVKEGNRERLQVFEGTVIGMKGEGIRETFNVRRISYGVGVERIFPVNSPKIDHIEVVRKGVVRRAKLYYLRERVGKASKVKERLETK